MYNNNGYLAHRNLELSVTSTVLYYLVFGHACFHFIEWGPVSLEKWGYSVFLEASDVLSNELYSS